MSVSFTEGPIHKNRAKNCIGGLQSGMGGLQGLRGTLKQADKRSGKIAENYGSLPKRPLSFQKSSAVCCAGCKAQAFGAGSLYLSRKAPTSENGAAGWHGRVAGTQGDVEAGRGEKLQDLRESWGPPKEASSIPEVPRLSWACCKALGFEVV